MRTFFLVFFFLSIFTNFSAAQVYLDYNTQETIDFFRTNKFISGAGNNSSFESQIQGSPYLNDEFSPGSIYTFDKQRYSDIPLRYNIYNDNLEFKTPAGEIQALATPEIVELAEFNSTQMVYLSYKSKTIKKGFFVLMEKGKVSLYSKPGVMFKEATEPGAYKDAEPPKFVRKSDEYYLQFNSEPAIIIGNKKDLIAAFPDNQDKIKSFISKNKIKTNKPEGLTELVKYYNSL
jgi:hypothetical protein